MPDWLVNLMPSIGLGVGAYAAIRADLAAIRAIANNAAKVADRAHSRLDALMGKQHG